LVIEFLKISNYPSLGAKKPDMPITKPIVTSPNRPQPPKQNRLTKKLLSLNSSLNSSSVLSSNPVYLDLPPNSNHSSLELMMNYQNEPAQGRSQLRKVSRANLTLSFTRAHQCTSTLIANIFWNKTQKCLHFFLQINYKSV
jgi:hypothetical protein